MASRTALSRLIRSIARLARVTRAGDDSGDFPIAQVGYMGKVGDAVMWFPYGIHANVREDELAIILSMQGNPEARVALAGSPTSRPHPIEVGEFVVYHPPSGSKIHFKANGDVEVDSKNDVRVTAAGDVDTTAGGDSSVTSGVHTVAGDLDHDGTNVGFHGVAPAPLSPAYNPINVTPDRAYDANLTTVGELADVLGTLIADLKLKGLIG